ncbi:hypothetical protein AU192_19915 [Mycobacterium lehmannii]|uniref:Uncharacterized protein n=1 Tax=Mycobacterium lehmannii TaxID=2048550 RepID=A0A101A3J8_9MYCO|nr:hypothetical protein [Mycobacterium lehmannii]KUI12336.1 hypothetical protein AU192_19915 [Mycobacterium lehmannii]
MTSLAIVRAVYGVALLVAPDMFHGRPRTERLTTATRRSMRILAARQLFEASVCGVDPSKCLLRMEAVVDVIHAGTMVVVAAATSHASTRRAAAVNVATAALFVGADTVAARRARSDHASPSGANNLLLARDRVAGWCCRTLPYPVGSK